MSELLRKAMETRRLRKARPWLFPAKTAVRGESATAEEVREAFAKLRADLGMKRREFARPTRAQIEAGNYPKKHVRVGGLEISIENRKGSIRSGQDKDGKPWRVKMPCDYGYIRGTLGKDGDHVDVFLGPERDLTDASPVWVMNQKAGDGKAFDEHKVLLGFRHVGEAWQAYVRAYTIPMHGKLVGMTLGELKAKIGGGRVRKEFRRLTRAGAGMGENAKCEPSEARQTAGGSPNGELASQIRNAEWRPRVREFYRPEPDDERRGFLGNLAIGAGLGLGVVGAARVLRPVIAREAHANAVRGAVKRTIGKVRWRVDKRAASSRSAVEASIQGDVMRRSAARKAAMDAKRAAAQAKREKRAWYASRKDQMTPEERRRAKKMLSRREFQVDPAADGAAQARGLAGVVLPAGLLGGYLLGRRAGAKDAFQRVTGRWRKNAYRWRGRIARERMRTDAARAEAASWRARAGTGAAGASGASSSSGSSSSWGGANRARSSSRGPTNPFAGDPVRGQKWDSWQAAERMAREAATEGEREAARRGAEKIKRRWNFSRALRVREFASDVTVVRQKRDALSKVRDAAQLTAAAGVLGLAGYAGLRVHGLYKLAKGRIPSAASAVRREAPGVARYAKATMRAVKRAADRVGRTANTINEADVLRAKIPGWMKGKQMSAKFFAEGERRGGWAAPLAAGVGLGAGAVLGVGGVRAVRRGVAAGLKQVRRAVPKVTKAAEELHGTGMKTADNVRNASTIYADLGRAYSWAKSSAAGGIYNIIHPRQTWREVKGAFRAGLRGEKTFPKVKRPAWALSRRMIGMKEFVQRDEDGIPFSGKVAKDRYIKKIRDEDLQRRDANLLRAGAAGAVAGALVPGRWRPGRKALVGAAAGAAGVIGVRAATRGRRDVYGERDRAAKRAELVPAVAGLGAAGWFAGRRLKAFGQPDKKERRLNPYAGAALSGAASGFGVGLIPLLQRGTRLRPVLKGAAGLAATSAAIVGGGALAGSRIIGDPKPDEGAAFTKRAAIGGALVGTAIGGAAGVAARRWRPAARMLVKASRGGAVSRPAMWLRKSGTAGAAGIGAVGGALYGAAQGADEGQQVDSIINLRKDIKRMSVREFGDKPFHGYNRKRHAKTGGLNDAYREKYNREHGSKLKRPVTKKPSELKPGSKAAKRRESFCARMSGVKGPTSKDGKLTPKGAALKRWNCEARILSVREFGYYNQPRREGRRVHSADGQEKWTRDRGTFASAVRAAAGLEGRLMKNPDGSVPTFAEGQYIRGFYNEGKRINTWGGRLGRLAGDTGAVLSGQPRRRDASGRPVKREWEKSWFQNAAGSALAGGALAGGAWLTANTRFGRQRVQPFLKRVIKGAEAKGFRLFERRALRQFDAWAEMNGWDVRDPRGRSARVFAPGSRRRIRREAEWHETKDGQRTIWQAVGAVGTVAGLGAGVLIGRGPKQIGRDWKAARKWARSGRSSGIPRGRDVTGKWRGNIAQGPWQKKTN